MSFERAGFESTRLISNLSVVIWILALHVVVLLGFYVPVWLLNRTFGILATLKSKLEGYFFWGGFLRLFMEAYLELLLTSVLNVYTADWDEADWQDNTSLYLSVAILGLMALLLPFLTMFFMCNLNAFKYDEFAGTYGAVLDGTTYETRNRRKVAITYPAVFILRRSIFVLSCIFWKDFFWGQIALQTVSSLLMACYVMQFRPLETSFGNRMEVANECTTLVLLYGLLSFTISIPDPDYRSTGGLFYIGVIVNNVLVHVFFLTRDTGHNMKLGCKKCCNFKNSS